jgi:hypothetical protein
MASATNIATAGLQGWRAKLADAVDEPVAQRTPLASEQVRAALGALFFALSLTYVVKTMSTAFKQLRDG